MRIAVIGASGQLGTDLVAAFTEAGDEVVPLTHDEVEIADAGSVYAVLERHRPDAVINTAAMHNVESCENDPLKAFQVNALGSRNLAEACRATGARLVHVSTDYVFDGVKAAPYVEEDLPRPLNSYGITKLAGENYVLAAAPDAVVVRTSGLYGLAPCRAKSGLNFVQLMLKLGRERGEVKVVTDEIVTPTYTAHLARQIVLITRGGHTGLLHATSQGQCSWYEFAAEIFSLASIEVDQRPAGPGEFPAKVPRPIYSVLENRGLQETDLDIMPPWRDSLRAYLAALGEIPAGVGQPSIPVSVVIPCYQGHETIGRALRSLEAQTVRPMEVVVVDDGSPRPLRPEDVDSELDVRVVRHDENRGISAARNTGIRAARYDWIGFLDRDDEWLPEKLERQWAEVLRGRPETPVIFGRCAFHGKGVPRPGVVLPRPGTVRRLTTSPEAALRELMLGGNTAYFISLLVHRRVLEASGYLDERITGGADDYELMLRLAAEGVPFACPEGPDPDVVHHHTGENHSDPRRWARDEEWFMPRLAEKYPSVRALGERGLARVSFRLGRFHDRRDERSEARRRYREAVARDPLWWKPRAALAVVSAPRWVRSFAKLLLRAARRLVYGRPHSATSPSATDVASPDPAGGGAEAKPGQPDGRPGARQSSAPA